MSPAQSPSPSRPMALMLVEGFPPAFARGGPPVSAANLIAATRDLVDWRVITRNDDVNDARPLAEDGQWLGDDPCVLRTNSYWRMGKAAHLALRRWPIRAVLANSLFAAGTRAAAAACFTTPHVPFVVLPRGELDPGALRLKRLRKAIFIRGIEALGIGSRAVFGSTSELETANIQRTFPRSRVLPIPNLSSDPENVPYRVTPRSGPLRLVFNSRVSEKKGLHIAIQALVKHPRPIALDIFGDDGGPYAQRCRVLAAHAPQHVQIAWRSMVSPPYLHARLRDYDAMVLPTLGENFGHAIAEALAAGTPAILPNTTPWTQALIAGAGVLLPSHQPSAVTAAVLHLEMMAAEDHARMRRAARAQALTVYGNNEALMQVRANVSLLVGRTIGREEQVCVA